VKEIHGFNAALGLKLLNPAAFKPAQQPSNATQDAAKHKKTRATAAG